MSKVQKTIQDLQRGQNPKWFEYELKEELKQRGTTHLLFKKFCDLQKFKLFELLSSRDQAKDEE